MALKMVCCCCCCGWDAGLQGRRCCCYERMRENRRAERGALELFEICAGNDHKGVRISAYILHNYKRILRVLFKSSTR